MIIAIIAAAAIWFLFGRKALAWIIIIGAVAFSLAVFFAPPIHIPPPCHDDLAAVPMKICPAIGDGQ